MAWTVLWWLVFAVYSITILPCRARSFKMYRTTLVLVVVSIFFAAVRSDEMYSDKYDTLNVEEYLANDDLRNKYYNCFMETGPCTEDAEYWRGNFPEAVVTRCKKCTEWQKTAFDKIASWYTEHDEKAWNALIEHLMQKAKEMNIPGAK